MEKIKEYFEKNNKKLLFIAIFIIVCSIYNLNTQNINYILKKGTILEYSYPKNININEEQIKEKLASINIKYSLIEENKNIEYELYDADDILIEKTLLVALPYLPREDKKELFNNISDFIFDNYKGSKLINISPLNDLYSKPYSSFLKFLGLLFSSLFIWLVFLYLIFNPKTLTQNFLDNCATFFIEQKNNFKKFIEFFEKIKSEGFSALFKEKTDKEEKKETKESALKEIIDTVVFVLVCVITIRYFIGELRWIPSGSMNPTILEGDRVYVEKLNFPKKEIKRGDILVFYPPETKLSNSAIAVFTRLVGVFCKDIAYIKRTIGMPGDKFEIKFDPKNEEYRVYINDKALDEPYISSRNNWTVCNENLYCGPFVIPEGHYFMMGDNRGNSKDSRFWGFLDEKRVIGRANFMFFPIKRINILTDKYLLLHEEKINDKIKEKNYLVNRY